MNHPVPAQVADASVALALSARRRNSENGDPEPVVALTRCDVAIDDLELTMDEHRFSWVFNSLAGLFRDQIRDYVCEALRDLVVDKSRDLLEPINALLGASWAPLRRALDLPDVADLPRLEGDCAAGDVDVTLRAPGPLGLELAQHPDDPRHLAVAGLVAGGQCAAALAQQGFSADDVVGARLVSVDGADARDLARDDTVVRVTSPARPRVLGLELAPGARAARARRRGGDRGGRTADVVLFDAAPAGRKRVIQIRFNMSVPRARVPEKSIHASRALREMIARPKISRNEWKTTETRATRRPRRRQGGA